MVDNIGGTYKKTIMLDSAASDVLRHRLKSSDRSSNAKEGVEHPVLVVPSLCRRESVSLTWVYLCSVQALLGLRTWRRDAYFLEVPEQLYKTLGITTMSNMKKNKNERILQEIDEVCDLWHISGSRRLRVFPEHIDQHVEQKSQSLDTTLSYISS